MDDYRDASEKFSSAMANLAISNSPLQDRLYNTFMGPLAMVKEENLPQAVQDEFRQLLEEMNRVKDEKQGTFFASTREMSPEKAAILIQKIVWLAREVAIYQALEENR